MPTIKVGESLKTFLKKLSEETGKPMTELIQYAVEQTFLDKLPPEFELEKQRKRLKELTKFIREVHKFQKTIAFAGKYGKQALQDKKMKAMRQLIKAQKLYPEALPQIQQEIETDLKAHALREVLAKELRNGLEELIQKAVEVFGIDPQEFNKELEITQQFKPELPPEPQRKSIIVRMGVR